MEIPVVIQYRHVHLSHADRLTLFGSEILESEFEMSHRGQFIAKQTVTIIGQSGAFEHVRILGPERSQTQVELSASDAHSLGVKASLRVSGDIERSARVLIRGPQGEVDAKSSTIIPIRHVHLPSSTAEAKGLGHGDVVSVQWGKYMIDHVVVRVHPTFSQEFHLTADEAAEFWIHTGDTITL